MQKIIFVTGNTMKANIAKSAAQQCGIVLEQREYQIDEIQGEDGEYIVRNKVLEAYKQAGEPVVVSDDCWSILGLNGFPGAYMKSMNHWLSTDDFLRLTAPLNDRRVVLTQRLAYHDGEQTLIISNDIPGTLLREPRGKPTIEPSSRIITMDGDNGLSIAEIYLGDHKLHDRKATAIWEQLLDQLKLPGAIK